MKEQELLSLADFVAILFRRKWVVIAIWFLVMALTVVYLIFAERTYQLKGTLYVGRFQEILLEEGEFVAKKLADYSFIKKALDSHGIEIDIPVTRLERMIKTDIINEVKKIKDVGIVQLTVEYKDRHKVLDIFKALTDQLVEDHGHLLSQCSAVFARMEAEFLANQKRLEASLEEDESFRERNFKKLDPGMTLPTVLLASHTIAEKRDFLKQIIKDRHYLLIEADSATKSYNTKLAAEPQLPDAPYKPKQSLTLIVGVILAVMAGAGMALALELYNVQIRPRL